MSRSGYRNRALWQETTPGPAAPDADRRPAVRGNIYDMEGRALSGATVLASTFELAGNIPSVAGTVKSDSRTNLEA